MTFSSKAFTLILLKINHSVEKVLNVYHRICYSMRLFFVLETIIKVKQKRHQEFDYVGIRREVVYFYHNKTNVVFNIYTH